MHPSHVLVLLFLYCPYMPLLFACGLSGPHPMTCIGAEVGFVEFLGGIGGAGIDEEIAQVPVSNDSCPRS